MTRFVAHLDMDAFYASVELLRYPQLRGLPLVIGGRRRDAADADASVSVDNTPRLRNYAGRGVITTATYEARKFGLHSGMGLMKAAQLAPDALLLPADFDRYRHFSRLFKAAVRGIAPLIEDRGIDEIYIELTELADGSWSRAREIAEQLQNAVREATSLSCSIGVTPNKLLSKLASELEKPGGLTFLREEEIALRIWPLVARKLNGIGPRATERLAQLGIQTIGELAAADPAFLVQQFGRSYGAWMHAAAHGRDERHVVTHQEPKSISRETTFDRDLHPVHDRARLTEIFTSLCVELATDLERHRVVGKTIGIKLRYDNFRTLTRDCTIETPTRDSRAIRHAAGECLKRVPLERRIRLLGVRASHLTAGDGIAPPQPATGSLFD